MTSGMRASTRIGVPRSTVPPVAALLLVLVVVVACGGPPGAEKADPSTPRLPSGFIRVTDRQLGFEIALAPGWKESERDPQGGVVYAGPRGADMLVHFEEAGSPSLDLATIPVLAELSGGGGLAGVHQSAASLARRRALRTQGRFSAAGGERTLIAYTLVDAGRVWAVALVGAPGPAATVVPDWEKMVSAFRPTGAAPTPPPRATVGLPAPGFPALDRVKGPVVINFFATWCVDCRSDMPVLAAAAADHGGRFTLIGVDCCGDDASKVPAFLKELGVQGRFRDVAVDDGRIARSYSLLGPPTTAVLDRDHVLRQMIAGPVTRSNLEQGLGDAGVR